MGAGRASPALTAVKYTADDKLHGRCVFRSVSAINASKHAVFGAEADEIGGRSNLHVTWIKACEGKECPGAVGHLEERIKSLAASAGLLLFMLALLPFMLALLPFAEAELSVTLTALPCFLLALVWYVAAVLTCSDRIGAADIVVTTYGMLTSDHDTFARIEWERIVLDEMQACLHLCRHRCRLCWQCYHLRRQYRR